MVSPFDVGLTASDLDRSVAFCRRVLATEVRTAPLGSGRRELPGCPGVRVEREP